MARVVPVVSVLLAFRIQMMRRSPRMIADRVKPTKAGERVKCLTRLYGTVRALLQQARTPGASEFCQSEGNALQLVAPQCPRLLLHGCHRSLDHLRHQTLRHLQSWIIAEQTRLKAVLHHDCQLVQVIRCVNDRNARMVLVRTRYRKCHCPWKASGLPQSCQHCVHPLRFRSNAAVNALLNRFENICVNLQQSAAYCFDGDFRHFNQ